MNGSIQRRVTARLLLGTLIAGVATNAGIYAMMRHEVLEQFDASIETRARALSSLVIAADVNGPLAFPFAGRDQPEFRRKQGHDFFEIWDGQGHVVARSPSLGNADLPRAPLVLNTLGDRIFDAKLPDGRQARCIEVRFAPFVSEPGTGFATSERARQVPADPPARIVLAADPEELNEALSHLGQTLGLGAIALAGMSTFVVVAVVRRGLLPLRLLAEDASRVDPEHLDAYRFHEQDLPDELRPIAQRLNDLLGRLASAFARERRFTADAAHELRTPIAELRSLSEVALRWPPGTEEEHNANYRHMLAATRQMEAVVAALLTLARHHANDGATRLSGEPVNLVELVTEAWRSHEPAARARSVRLHVNVPGELTVVADRAVLLAMLHNLLSNVVSYAVPETSATCAANETSFTIENVQQGLSGDDLPQLAVPFWRKDTSRSSNRQGHVGLGLTLVKEYAAALGFTCTFAIDGGAFRATLAWPASAFVPTHASVTSPATLEAHVPETRSATH